LLRLFPRPPSHAVKAQLGVPQAFASCHTAELGEYIIEGHLPAGAIARLLAEKPAAKGLAEAKGRESG